MLDLDGVRMDPTKLRNGNWWAIWKELDLSISGKPMSGPNDGPCVLVVPQGLAWERALDAAREPFLERIREGKLTEEESRTIQGKALAKAVFRDCRNLSIRGEPIVWSEEKAIELMTDPQWLSLQEFVLVASRHRAASAAREEAAAAKN